MYPFPHCIADLAGALDEPNRFNPTDGSIASPSFPGLYTTSMEWNLDFPYLVILDIRVPFFDLRSYPLDSLEFINEETGSTIQMLDGDHGSQTSFSLEPVRQLSIELHHNDIETNTGARGFILYFQGMFSIIVDYRQCYKRE